jgi:hypothetical protein
MARSVVCGQPAAPRPTRPPPLRSDGRWSTLTGGVDADLTSHGAHTTASVFSTDYTSGRRTLSIFFFFTPRRGPRRPLAFVEPSPTVRARARAMATSAATAATLLPRPSTGGHRLASSSYPSSSAHGRSRLLPIRYGSHPPALPLHGSGCGAGAHKAFDRFPLRHLPY